MNNSRIVVALDFNDAGEVLNFVIQLDPLRCRLKVGKELFTHAGPRLVERLIGLGYDVFLDLKFHDIPNTVAGAVGAAANLGVWMVNVHASGGRPMMESARERIEQCDHRPLLIAVTVLTSLGSSDLEEIGFAYSAEALALRLARLAQQSGMDGVVCSPREARLLRTELGPDFRLVTPGVRPAGAAADDQVRIATPAQALGNGADFLVIGRPITRADDPMAALQAIEAEIAAAAPGGRR